MGRLRCVLLIVCAGVATAQDCCPHNGARCEDSDWTQLTLPEGFCFSRYASVGSARTIEVHEDEELGIVTFVGTADGEVHVLFDDDDIEPVVIDFGNNNNRLVATMRNNQLYVAQISRLLRADNIMEHLRDGTTPEFDVLYGNFPTSGHHGARTMAWRNNDQDLYIAVSIPSNNEEPEAISCNLADCFYSEIIYVEDIANKDTLSVDDFNVFANGIRSVVGMTNSPIDDALWFTENGRDRWANDNPGQLTVDSPPDELNVASESGLHFGYPYCYGYSLPDGLYAGQNIDCDDYEGAYRELDPHIAPLGLAFAPDTMPEPYNRGVFIAEHGSWNRPGDHLGYRITHVDTSLAEPSYDVFLDGFLTDPTRNTAVRFGRPSDVAFMPDGSMLFTDDDGGNVYRVQFDGEGTAVSPTSPPEAPPSTPQTTEDDNTGGINQQPPGEENGASHFAHLSLYAWLVSALLVLWQ